MTELLNCPFCGGAPEVTIRAGSQSEHGAFVCFIACMGGGYTAHAHQDGAGASETEARADAIAAWNRRAALADHPASRAEPALNVNLDQETATFLRDMLDAGDEVPEITLSLGYIKDDDGSVKYGLRVHETEYPEEGCSMLVEMLAAPTAEPGVDAAWVTRAMELADDFAAINATFSDSFRRAAREELRAHLSTASPVAQTQTAGTQALSDKQIEDGWRHVFSTENPFNPVTLKAFTKAVRWAEVALRASSEPGGRA